MTDYMLPADPDGMNDDRAKWADEAIRAFKATTGCDIEDALCDLICDLRHWADHNQLNFDRELERAEDLYAIDTFVPVPTAAPA